MAITYTKDIPDFITKVKQVTDISELETTVNQLSASMLEVQGDITTLAGAMTTANEEIDDIWESNNILGAKNLNSYPYNETTHTENGVVWTDNGDGTIKANNKATGNSDFFCHSRVPTSLNSLQLPNGNYILTGCPSGGGNSTFFVRIQATLDGSATTIAQDNGEGATFTINGDDNNTDFAVVTVDCRVVNDYTASDLVFKPMIRLAEYQDSIFTSYAMTNKELTNIVQCKQTTNGTYTLKATVSSSGVTYAWVADD